MYVIKKAENISDVILDFKVSEIVKTNRIKDLNTGATEIEHTLLTEINIDKKSLILKNVKKAELYMCKLSSDDISQRVPQSASSESNNHFNESVVNSNLYRLNRLKTHFGMSDISKEDFIFLDEVDLSLNLDKSTINKVKSKRISDADAFGTIEKYKIVDNNLNEIPDNAESKLEKNYFKYIDNLNKGTDVQNYNYHNIIKNLKSAGISILGNNTSGLSKYIEQEKHAATFQQSISGNFNKIFYKGNRHQVYNNLLSKIKNDHLGIAQAFFEDVNQKKLSIVKEVKRYENVKKQFTFNNSILDGGAASLFLVLYDSKGIKSEVSIIDFDIDLLVNNFKYPEFDYDFSVSKQDRRKIVGNIYNNENMQRNYVITYQTLGENNLSVYDTTVINNEASNKKVISVPAKSSKFFTLISNSKNKNYLFASRLQYNGKIYGNVKYASCNKSKSSTRPDSSFIDFHCKNTDRGILIKIKKNQNEKVRSFLIYKRNLTKKQKKFQVVNRIIANANNDFVYEDYNLEDKNIYEYKVSKINTKGLTQISSNSFIEKYCSNKNLGTLNVSVLKTNQTVTQTDFSLDINFIKKESENDKLIKALTGNFFSLFENVLTEINQDSGIVIDAIVTAYNHVSGETLDIDIVTLVDNQASVNFSLPHSIYTIKVATRLELPTILLEAIGSAQQSGTINNDIFLDKETGNTYYSYQNTLNMSSDLRNITHSQSQVILIKSTSQKETSQKKEKSFFNYFETFFSIEDYYNLDYMIMSYVENNYMPVIYGLGYIPRVNQEQQTLNSISNYRFTYKIPSIKGNVAFLAQPVFIDGSLGTPFVIGNFLSE